MTELLWVSTIFPFKPNCFSNDEPPGSQGHVIVGTPGVPGLSLARGTQERALWRLPEPQGSEQDSQLRGNSAAIHPQ